MFNGDLQKNTLEYHDTNKHSCADLRGLERVAAKLRDEFLIEVIFGGSILPSANHRARSYQTKTPRKGWHHNKSLIDTGGLACELLRS